MCHVLDMFRHTARVTPENLWWWDGLENGPGGRYAGDFDIDWDGDLEESRHTRDRHAARFSGRSN
jgi:maltooligosyltrehalose synthase